MASVDEQVVDASGIKSLQMSRSDIPEVNDFHLDLKIIQNIIVYDEDGNEKKVGDIYNERKTILILVRHFLCFICKEYVDDLSLIPESALKEADVQLVVVGCSESKFIKPFRQATGYTQALYVDPNRALYKALGCSEKINITSSQKGSRHVKSSFLSGIFQSVWRGMEFRQLQGDIHQQGGSFIIGPGSEVVLAHRDLSAIDHMPINDLLGIAGVTPVNFPHDQRVLTV